MSHKNPIADELCRSFVNENGRKVGGNAALLKYIKDAGGIDHVIDTIQESTIKATAASIFSDTIASEKRAKIKKIG